MSDKIEEVEFDEDIFDSMVHGSYEEPVVEEDVDDSVDEDEVEDTDTLEDDEYQEDTDQEDESEDEEELDEDSDGDLDEDSDDKDEDEEEDSLVDDDSSDDEDGDTEGDDEDSEENSDDEGTDEDDNGADEGTDEESEEESDTEQSSDGEVEDTDAVDYKAFYDAVVNTEFVVNGNKVKGFADPKKIIQSQQMAGGFSEKMAGFKKYRPYMAPLEDRGMLDDPAKFDLAMNLIDGDKEAIKQHLQSLKIDPLEFDMEAINYQRSPATASSEFIIVEDAMERARNAGIEDRVRHVIGKEWDSESFEEFVSNPAVRNDLLTQMENGTYDIVEAKMHELSRLDYNGSYSAMKTTDRYRAAITELQKEAKNKPAEVVKKAPIKKTTVKKKPSVKAEKAKIEKARADERYKAKAKEREDKIAKQRSRASSMSKKKPKAKAKVQFDPMKVEGADLDNLMDQLIAGGRG